MASRTFTGTINRTMSPASIDLSWTVNATIQRHPITADVFREHGVDICCGGGATLYAAARDAGVDRGVLLAALRHALADDGVEVA